MFRTLFQSQNTFEIDSSHDTEKNQLTARSPAWLTFGVLILGGELAGRIVLGPIKRTYNRHIGVPGFQKLFNFKLLYRVPQN